MPTNFAQYLVDDDDENGPEFWNRILKDIDNRIAAVEDKLGLLDEATEALIQRGLDKINTQLQATIDDIQGSVSSASDAVAALQAALTEVEDAVTDIVSGSTPASVITISAISGVVADNVQAAIAEHQGDIESLEGDVSGLQDQVNGIGDIQTVNDYTAAAALTDLNKGDIVHVLDNGSGKWIRYQVIAAGDGTWGGCTKVVIFTQDQQPASHTHAIADVTGLQAALDAKLAATSYTAADVLAKLLTVDGDASGLDADTWKGATFTVSTSTPSGGVDGDFWFEREA